eukprot:gene3942-4313_t
MIASVTLVLVLAFLCTVNAFMLTSRALVSSNQRRLSALHMSTNEEDPMEAIRAKMKANPNYDPTKDPEAMRALESEITGPLREFPNAIQRLRVAYQDVTSGLDPIDDLDARVSAMGADSKGLISSPQSTWLKEGMPAEKVDKAKKQALREKLRKEFPQVPEK